ncbi:MAG: cytochrome C oxidase subunit III [gamma proteobacterium symbiont of Ctena orbiculata]|nr:MAG: cytochrome C oxidase subunit III [gamma proteobacterium symbiont of Ctena orbiculata]PVV18292.1 MAG: cytochrome C oxidase subunit III [gamma proteobacterium symbiont of Ctena orbiculata]PVV22394.1 MAG: cytochrome C oxidase subunit III [gamma proteobacterium symbiont of Ctena orbiculata]
MPDPIAPTAQAVIPAKHHIPGNMAIWVGILSEMTEFALMFIVYFLAKVHNPEFFAAGPLQLNTTAGVLNTLVLLSSSYFVIKAIKSIRIGQVDMCQRWLWSAVAMGVLYLIIKFYEYHWNSERGLATDTDIFFTVYYYTTFNHLLHVGWGSGAILWAIMGIRMGGITQHNHSGLEAVAVYWHMIDLAWIVIFPLLYVLR